MFLKSIDDCQMHERSELVKKKKEGERERQERKEQVNLVLDIETASRLAACVSALDVTIENREREKKEGKK